MHDYCPVRLPNTFWAETVSNAAAIHNRLPQAEGKFRHRYPSRERKQPLSFWANTATRATRDDIANRNVLNNLRNLSQCHNSQPVETDTPSLKVALKSQNSDLWEAAIHEELESLREAQTWDEVEVPKGAKAFPSKFVLKVERHSDWAVESHKARLVLLGNMQRLHIDFYDIYAPVADLLLCASCLLSHASKNGLSTNWM
jgi:Reverse transcriptase (RNA-dependent DNA polymerase)